MEREKKKLDGLHVVHGPTSWRPGSLSLPDSLAARRPTDCATSFSHRHFFATSIPPLPRARRVPPSLSSTSSTSLGQFLPLSTFRFRLAQSLYAKRSFHPAGIFFPSRLDSSTLRLSWFELFLLRRFVDIPRSVERELLSRRPTPDPFSG